MREIKDPNTQSVWKKHCEFGLPQFMVLILISILVFIVLYTWALSFVRSDKQTPELTITQYRSTQGDFIVEVDSPGLDRVLRTKEEFIRTKGKEIGVWFKEDFEFKKYLEGVLLEISGDVMVLETKNKTYEIPLEKINCAKQKLIYK